MSCNMWIYTHIVGRTLCESTQQVVVFVYGNRGPLVEALLGILQGVGGLQLTDTRLPGDVGRSASHVADFNVPRNKAGSDIVHHNRIHIELTVGCSHIAVFERDITAITRIAVKESDMFFPNIGGRRSETVHQLERGGIVRIRHHTHQDLLARRVGPSFEHHLKSRHAYAGGDRTHNRILVIRVLCGEIEEIICSTSEMSHHGYVTIGERHGGQCYGKQCRHCLG